MYELKRCSEIRLYPLSKNDFPSCEFAKLFIRAGFHEDGDIFPGLLTYKDNSYIDAPLTFFYPRAFILFQYKGEIIGCGVLKDSKDTEFDYRYSMDMSKVCVFDDNITLEEFKSIVKNFKRFNSVAQKIDKKYLPEIINLINKKSKKSNIILDENTSIVYNDKEGGIVEYYTTKYERHEKYRREAIRLHGLSCEICGFNFFDTYGNLGHNYIEVHHRVSLHTLNEEVIPNPETDMVCVCSNCHRMLHRDKYSILQPETLKNLIEKRKLNKKQI